MKQKKEKKKEREREREGGKGEGERRKEREKGRGDVKERPMRVILKFIWIRTILLLKENRYKYE